MLRMALRELRQCLVERNNIYDVVVRGGKLLVQCEPHPPAPAFGPSVASSVIDKNPSDRLSGDGKEMGPVLPFGALLIHQFQVSLVDECSRLECVARALLLHQLFGERSQTVVNQRQELIRRPAVALAGVHEELGNVSVAGRHLGPQNSGEKMRLRVVTLV